MADLKVKFRDQLDKFATEHYGAPISRLTDMQRSEALTFCYLMSVRNALLPATVPDDFEELSQYFCDAQYDRSADFIYRSDDGHVTIVQAKHRNPAKTEAEADFDAFRRCLIKLCPATRPAEAKINQKVLDLISDIDWEADNFSLIYVSLARTSEPISRSAEDDLDDIVSSPLSDISARSELIYVSEDELNKQWRDVLSQATGVAPAVELLLAQAGAASHYEYIGETGARSFIAALSAAQVHQIYTRHRDRLFNLNIRNYIGDTRTNKEIIRTAQTDASNFFFYNNGISAVARKVDPKAHSSGTTVLTCTDFSIINGAQTFRSISKAYSKSAALTKHVNVLLRITQIDFSQAGRG